MHSTGDQGLQDAFTRYNTIAAGLLKQGLAGQIFTQITDIECEVNGLLTYDRTSKVDHDEIRKANLKLLAAHEVVNGCQLAVFCRPTCTFFKRGGYYIHI